MTAVAVMAVFFCAGALAQERPASRGLAIAVGSESAAVRLYSASFALVIGVSEYSAGWPRLPGVAEDVVAVHDALRRHGFDVTVVTDPTREAFDVAVRRFISLHGLDAENRVLVYFAGHGETLTMPDGRQLGFVVPADAPLPRTDPVKFDELAISMDLIEAYARRIRSKHALFVFDSCFSGSLFTALRGIPPAISERVRNPVRQFITAGSASQQVPDRSQFRRSFVEALQGAADTDDDGYVTGMELGYWLEQQVTNYSKGSQTPKYGKIRDAALDRGDVVFLVPDTGDRIRSTTRPVVRGSVSAPTSEDLSRREELAFWESVKDSGDRRAVEGYLERFGAEGRFSKVARMRLMELDRRDPKLTAAKFLEALVANDTALTWELSAPMVRQRFTPEGFASALQPYVGHGDGARQMVYFEVAPDGQRAFGVYQTGERFERVALATADGQWGVWTFAVPVVAAPPQARDAAARFVRALNAGRAAAAYGQLATTTRAQYTPELFQQLFASSSGSLWDWMVPGK